MVYTLEKETKGSIAHIKTEPRSATVLDEPQRTASTFKAVPPQVALEAAKYAPPEVAGSTAKKRSPSTSSSSGNASPDPAKATSASTTAPKPPKKSDGVVVPSDAADVSTASPGPAAISSTDVLVEHAADGAAKKKRKRRRKKAKKPSTPDSETRAAATTTDGKEDISIVDDEGEEEEEVPMPVGASSSASSAGPSGSAPIFASLGHTSALQPLSTADASSSLGMGDWDDDDVDSGWVTPDNVVTYTRSYAGQTEADSATEKPWLVTCITADFAMQNVLLQMGLHLTSVDGFSIKALQRWILRCYGCRFIVKDMNKLFCPRCGNNTLHRCQYTVDDDGNLVLQNIKTKISTRGTKYSVPLPKGGRNAPNLILSESQLPSWRPKSKANSLADTDASFLDPHGRTTAKDVVVGYGRKNPNEPRKKFGKKNKAKARGF